MLPRRPLRLTRRRGHSPFDEAHAPGAVFQTRVVGGQGVGFCAGQAGADIGGDPGIDVGEGLDKPLGVAAGQAAGALGGLAKPGGATREDLARAVLEIAGG